MAKYSYVLDASGVIRSSLDYSSGGYLIPESIYAEIHGETARCAVEEAIGRGDIKIVSSDEKSLEIVRKAAQDTGDISALSTADLDVLAVALKHKLTIITDDYAIQNTAAKIGVKSVGVAQDGIKKQLSWVWVCIGCGTRMAGPGTCDVCGQKAKKVLK